MVYRFAAVVVVVVAELEEGSSEVEASQRGNLEREEGVDQAGNKGSSEEEVVVVVAQYRKAGVEAEAGIDHNCSEEVAEEELRTKQASRASCLNQKGIPTLVRSLLVQLNNSEV